MNTSGGGGGGASSTWTAASAEIPFGAAAVIVASPGATPVTTPLELTVATVASLVVQLKATFAIGLPSASRAVATSWVAPPTVTVAPVGSTPTVATSAGGGGSTSLQAPKLPA